jgi:hypothetical protein
MPKHMQRQPDATDRDEQVRTSLVPVAAGNVENPKGGTMGDDKIDNRSRSFYNFRFQ